MKNQLKICAIATFMLSACLASPAHATENIFACEPEWGALAKEIGGEDVSIFVATTGHQDPHQIQARPGLISHAAQADLAFCTGAELEIGWMPLILRNAANSKIQPGAPGYLEATSVLSLKEKPERLDRAEGDVHAAGNPHVQTDPRNFIPVADVLASRLEEIDPANAANYKARHDAFLAKWRAAIQKWQTEAAPLNGMPIAVQHKSWIYLIDWLHLKQVVSLEPKPGVPPSSGYLATVLDTLKKTPVKMTIHAAYEDNHSAEWLQQNASVPDVELPFTIGGTDKDVDLFDLFDDTIDQLLKGAKP